VVEVWYLAEAVREREQLSVRDRVALDHAIEKLELLGAQLPAPHQKNVIGADRIRELRPGPAGVRLARSTVKWISGC
jgi:hypothetical protein